MDADTLTAALDHFFYDMSLAELRMMNQKWQHPHVTYNSLLYLTLIDSREHCTAGHLAQALGISKAAVAVKLGELIRQGLVVKTRSRHDGRVFHLSLSEDIRQEFRSYDRLQLRAVTAMLEQYSPEQLETFCGMLELITRCYCDEEPPANDPQPDGPQP